MPSAVGTEDHLKQLYESTKKTYIDLRNKEGEIPKGKESEYWLDRSVARMALESAENAIFANLVEEQKRRLPELTASTSKLASDVQVAENALSIIELVSSSLGVLGEVIALFAPRISVQTNT